MKIKPMLLHNYRKYSHKILYPAFVQPKYDGLRVIAQLTKSGKVNLITRQGNIITNLSHINKDLKKLFKHFKLNKNIYFDGEIFTRHLIPEHFKSINRITKLTDKAKKKISLLKFYIFDFFNLKNMGLEFSQRRHILSLIHISEPTRRS